ncbi:hypothetical protein [Sporocytophaga myxococcoides]|uniref:hypothetical protein n=1 Tax=Sporocytophaga myxococcoides TaxID=153721 RepID=UPI0003F4DC77|nr:hypothetical protein [Sporocytophaga myxococcoides]
MFFIILIVSILCIGFYLFKQGSGNKSILSQQPRKPNLEVPVTYTIEWWPEQNKMTIESFNIEIIESKLNLLNSKSLLAYKVSGSLKSVARWQSFIYKVHISERFNSDTSKPYERIIEITPIVSAKKNENTTDSTYPFEFKNEHIVFSSQWGVNRIKFICGSKEQVIELKQRK